MYECQEVLRILWFCEAFEVLSLLLILNTVLNALFCNLKIGQRVRFVACPQIMLQYVRNGYKKE